VVEGDAIRLVRHLCAKWGGDIRYHLQFGTAKWLLDRSLKLVSEEARQGWPAFLDFATARAEFYKEPTALPTVRQSSIKQDLHRRDFTINSMAIRLAPEPMGDLIDYYNGERDLNNKVIRVLHSLSFVDDATRIIRAVRFEQRLGFQIEPRTEKLLRAAYPLLDRVTGERIRNELEHILNEPEPLKALTRLDELGVLRQILPGVMIDLWFSAAYRALLSTRQMPPWVLTRIQWDWGILALLTLRLSEAHLEAAGQRLLIPQSQMKYLEGMQAGYHQLCVMTAQTPPSAVVDVLEKLDESGWLVLWAAMPTAELRQMIVKFVTQWRFIKASINGRQLIALGVRPGPALGAMLRELRRAWLDGEIINVEQEKGYVEKLIRGDLNNTRTPT
jgi:tRNA nucleotidyltransferase (CCA-adding enzyme)